MQDLQVQIGNEVAFVQCFTARLLPFPHMSVPLLVFFCRHVHLVFEAVVILFLIIMLSQSCRWMIKC